MFILNNLFQLTHNPVSRRILSETTPLMDDNLTALLSLMHKQQKLFIAIKNNYI